MPVCFTLARKESPERHLPLSTVDEELCKHLDVPIDAINYHYDWYDSIGLRLAVGKTFPEIEQEYLKYQEEAKETKALEYYNHMLKIINFLSNNFVSNNWREFGKL